MTTFKKLSLAALAFCSFTSNAGIITLNDSNYLSAFTNDKTSDSRSVSNSAIVSETLTHSFLIDKFDGNLGLLESATLNWSARGTIDLYAYFFDQTGGNNYNFGSTSTVYSNNGGSADLWLSILTDSGSTNTSLLSQSYNRNLSCTTQREGNYVECDSGFFDNELDWSLSGSINLIDTFGIDSVLSNLASETFALEMSNTVFNQLGCSFGHSAPMDYCATYNRSRNNVSFEVVYEYQEVPEPQSLLIFGLGLFGLVTARKKLNHK